MRAVHIYLISLNWDLWRIHNLVWSHNIDILNKFVWNNKNKWVNSVSQPHEINNSDPFNIKEPPRKQKKHKDRKKLIFTVSRLFLLFRQRWSLGSEALIRTLAPLMEKLPEKLPDRDPEIGNELLFIPSYALRAKREHYMENIIWVQSQ